MQLTQLPTRAEFIREQLGVHLEGLGHEVAVVGQHNLRFDTPGLGADGVWVTETGAFHAIGGRPSSVPETVTFDGFDWAPEPTDTGVMHEPTRNENPRWLQEARSVARARAQRDWGAPGFEDRTAGYRVPGTTRTV